MIIDGLQYQVEGYRLRFKLSKRRILILAALTVLTVALAMATAHAAVNPADPTTWPTWAAGGGGRDPWHM